MISETKLICETLCLNYLPLYSNVSQTFSIQMSTTIIDAHLTFFLFKCLTLSPNVSHTFSIQLSTTFSSCFSHILYSIIYHYSSCYSSHNFHSIHYSSSCSSAVLSAEELAFSVCVSVSSDSFIRSVYTALGSHIQCLWNDRGVLAAKKSAL